jgi:hypothetical protein
VRGGVSGGKGMYLDAMLLSSTHTCLGTIVLGGGGGGGPGGGVLGGGGGGGVGGGNGPKK